MKILLRAEYSHTVGNETVVGPKEIEVSEKEGKELLKSHKFEAAANKADSKKPGNEGNPPATPENTDPKKPTKKTT